MDKPDTQIDACTLTRTGRILILQLTQIEEEMEALKQLFNAELKPVVEASTRYLSVQYPTKDSATAWDWFTDFVANKCLSMKYFLSQHQCFAPQHALDTAPKDADSAHVKLKQAVAFANGVQNITTLLSSKADQSLSVFDALRDQLADSESDATVRDAALAHIDRIHYNISQLHRTLNVMRFRYRDFLVAHYMSRTLTEA